jgi:hypothetical protein
MDIFLLNTVFIVIVCGIILTIIGNFILVSYPETKNEEILSCSHTTDTKTNNNGYNGYTLSFTGLTIIGLALIFLMILIMYISVIGNKNGKELIQLLLPIFITLIIVSYDFFINIKFKDKLTAGKIASEYFGYLIFFTLLLFSQIGCIYKYIYDIKNNNTDQKYKSKFAPVIYLLSLLNMILLGIMNIIIAYFSTDG